MKKALPAAIALAGSLGFAAAANAVNVNSDGLGEVLLYSYYTVEDGKDTYVNITNTTDNVVAVKVRFVESMNSQEVLDFNLYLSPYDVWVGTVTADGTGAKLTTDDKSCTVPAIPAAGQAFRNYQYQGSTYHTGKGGPQGIDRTRTGHLEVIEMGVVYDISSTFAPASVGYAREWRSAQLRVASRPRGTPVASGAATKTVAVSSPLGGLYGSGIIIDVDGGTEVSYDAVALDEFSSCQLHSRPGSILPNLDSGEPEFTLPGGGSFYFANSSRDAVSAVLQKAVIANDYVTVSELDATTDWVVTFPTKSLYVSEWIPTATGAVNSAASASPEPFTNFWTSAPVGGVAGSACEPMSIMYFDREEDALVPDDLDFSPQPPAAPGFALCWEANVIGINGSSVLGGGYNHSNLDLAFEKGWMAFDFTGSVLNGAVSPAATYNRVIDTSAGYIHGLPVIGFAASQLVNGDVGGLLSNYAGSTTHKAEIHIVD